MPSALQQLQEMSVIVADTGDPAMVRNFEPEDCTTNPSLVLAAMESEDLQDVISSEIVEARAKSHDVEALCDTLTVAIGAKLSTLVPGRVSTEVDARLSFDADGSVRRAFEIVEDYDRRGISKERILIKLASTWEGIQAAEKLEREGINCNLTLLLSMEQARACADAGVYLISPFVGRITDWYKAKNGIDDFAPDQDPGVQSVREIYAFYKSNQIQTVVMAASFRNTSQIKALAGCDRLTISPKLLADLQKDEGEVARRLSDECTSNIDTDLMGEATFRWGLNQNAMASDKLAEGIRSFHEDHCLLLQRMAKRLADAPLPS